MIFKAAATTTALFASLSLFAAPDASAHCQVPCGIYDDHARVHAMREDIKTVAKAVKMINQLAKKRDVKSRNQLVRWVFNKEKHAERIIRTISDYFMAQKIKPPKTMGSNTSYLRKLASHHRVMVAAMKCKQSANKKAVAALTKAVDGIEGFWKKK